MNKPNGLMINIENADNKRYNVFYIKNEDGSYREFSQEYKKSTNIASFDPIDNWLTLVPDIEWIHPISGAFDNDGGFTVKAAGRFHQSQWKGQNMSIKDMYFSGVLFKKFDEILEYYDKTPIENIVSTKDMVDNMILDDFKNK